MKRTPTTLAASERKVAELISSRLEGKALAALEECLDAEVFVRAGRGANGIEYRAVPDRAVRLAAAVKVIEFSRGKPATSLTVTQVPRNMEQVVLPGLGEIIARHPDVAEQYASLLLAHARSVVPIAPANAPD